MAEPADMQAIVHDHLSGAREIAARALRLVQKQATHSRAETATALAEELFDTAVKVIRSKPEMAVVFNVLDRLFRNLESVEETAGGVGDFRMRAVADAGAEVDALRDNVGAAGRRAADLVANGDVVVTHSRSSTVLEALRQAKEQGKVFDVVVTESRPLLEGRTLAEELAALQVPVRMVVDAAAANAVEGADRVMVGADSLLNDAFVNKVGTRNLALAARESQVPFVVVAELDKAWRKRRPPSLASAGTAREVWDRAPVGVDVVNLAFEATPADWVARVAWQGGVGSYAEFWGRVVEEGFARRIRDVFGDEVPQAA